MAKYFRTFIVLLPIIICAQDSSVKFDEIGPIVIPDCVLQDSYGFIWIGAQEGLVRYDGYNLKRYSQIPFDSTSLSNNWVMTIEEDKNGNLWIGTWGGGLNYFNQKTQRFKHYELKAGDLSNHSSMNISNIIVNEDGSLWLGTQFQGLVNLQFDINGRPDIKRIDLKSDPTSSAITGDNFVLELYKDQNGKLWIGTIGGGLKMLDTETGKIIHFKHNPDNQFSISSDIVSAICEDTNGNLWIGTGHMSLRNGNGLNKFDPVTKKFSHYKHKPGDSNSLASNNVVSLLIDSENVLWIGTLGNYLNSIPLSELLNNPNPRFTHYTNFDRANINSVYEDRSGNIWIALFGRKVYRYNRQQNPFIWYHYVEGKKHTLWCSASMVQTDKSGNIWFGGGGLDCYNPMTRQYTHYYHDPDNPFSLSSNQTTSICEDHYGYYWIGTADKGLNRFDPKKGIFEHFQEDPENPFGLGSDIINEVLTSQTGDLWITSAKSGIQLYNIEENRFYRLSLDTSMTADVLLYGLYEDHTGTLWIQTANYGLYSFQQKNQKIEKIKHYKHNPDDRSSLSYNLIMDVIRPQIVDTSALWVATGNGLNRLDLKTNTFTHFYMEQGLPSNHILKVLEDDEGNIWCTCATGLAVYNIKSGKIRSYDKDDGMPISDFASRSQNACKTSDGQLIFGAAWGALGFYPDQLKRNMIIPRIYLTDFRIYHESIELDTAIQFVKHLELTHNQNAFSLEFVALNYINPTKNQYAYKVEGFHDDWIQCGNKRIASFTNLDPGKYVFRVKGSNNHDIWNKKGTSIEITILPPWWRTNWAYFVYAFLIFLTLYALRTYDLKRQRLKHQLNLEHEHTKKIQEIDRMKSRFFANISHEFRTPLTLILGPIKKWLPQLRNRNMKQDLEMMQRNAHRLLRLINQLLDLSRIESGGMALQVREDDIVHLLRRYVQSFESLAKIKHIHLKFVSKKKSIIMYLDRDKIEKIIYNLLSNAFKFTPECGEIAVGICSGEAFPDKNLNNPKEIDRNASPLQSSSSQKSNIQYPTSNITDHESRIPNYQFQIPDSHFVKIAVTNTDSYIPPEKIDRIFDRFMQLDDSEIKGQAGSGIGLALTKELVELHYGQITVESRKGTGTKFIITLPLGKEHLQGSEVYESSPQISQQIDIETVLESTTVTGGQPRIRKGLPLIMIVEDNPDVRFYIREQIESDYRIVEAVDGTEGLHKAIEKIPDLVISDVMMPRMDGFEFCRKLKTDERTNHIPVILLTARAESRDKIDGLETGADDYLIKPFDNRELRTRIKNLITQREKLRSRYLKTFSLEYDDPKLTSRDQSFITKIESIIDKHISDSEFNVSDFAREVGFSHSQLIRKLQNLTGLKPSQYIRLHRLMRARQMFDQKAGNISQVAFDNGFNNLSYFSRSFKAQFGSLPSDYLKHIS